MSKVNFPDKMALFGCGNMAGAMLRGWLAADIDPARFSVVKPTPANLPSGVSHYTNAQDAGGPFKMLMLGVKPQILPDVADDVRDLLAADATVISILAGAELEYLQSLFPETHIIRVMPNLAVEIGQSPLGIWAGDISAADKQNIDAMLKPLGMPEWLESEDQMDALTALAGSGPAFVYRFIDALAAGGTATGLPEEQAQRLAIQMVVGAAQLASMSDASPAELARRVAAKGGMTAEGLDVLDENGALGSLVKNTLRATRDRGAELARLAKGETTS